MSIPFFGDPKRLLVMAVVVVAVIWASQNLGFMQTFFTKTKLPKPVL